MNPYAAHLGDDDPLAVIAATPKQLSSLVDAAGPEGIERPSAPGKWSIRQILCHLADCELVFAVRLRHT
ncbi:MAG: DinB family protein, partial [Bryobacteraceae bacterium]